MKIQSILVVFGFLGLLASCDNSTATVTVASPSFSLPPRTYDSSQTTSITNGTAGTVIFYTTDGSIPWPSSIQYTGSIPVNRTETLKAIAVLNGVSSAISSATYTIKSPPKVGSQFPWDSSVAYGIMTDVRDGHDYRTIVIANTIWMAENLNFAGTTSSVGVCYNNTSDSCAIYGRLYTWSEAMAGDSAFSSTKIQGICPTGYHLPSASEWTAMEQTMGDSNLQTSLSGNLYAMGSGWGSSGFRALAAGESYGSFNTHGVFADVGKRTYWYTSTESPPNAVWTETLDFTTSYYWSKIDYQSRSYSIRCLQ